MTCRCAVEDVVQESQSVMEGEMEAKGKFEGRTESINTGLMS